MENELTFRVRNRKGRGRPGTLTLKTLDDFKPLKHRLGINHQSPAFISLSPELTVTRFHDVPGAPTGRMAPQTALTADARR